MSDTDLNNDIPDRDENTPDAGEVYKSVDTVSNQLSTIETFIARRFDELSMEINATSQQVDMAEEGIARRFGEIFEILRAVSFSEDGNTPANTGVELDAVVEMTEKAATRIMDATERISEHVNGDFTSEDQRKTAVEDMNKDIEEIFLACSFQDITGQRVRKTLESLKMIEDRLGTAMDKIGINIAEQKDIVPPVEITEASSQDDIDALFDD